MKMPVHFRKLSYYRNKQKEKPGLYKTLYTEQPQAQTIWLVVRQTLKGYGHRWKIEE
ncbi:MAG: hypothetical protein KAI81_05955 [Candidatus Marinimicrobia bacterium]|nr:hypothetical protein [Candidatus Neomarinimicrobiota bacterium]